MNRKRVFITGVHTGLGQALAKQYVAGHARVYAVSRHPPEQLGAAAELRFMQLDLRRFDAIFRVLATLLEGVQALDLVLLNAGVFGQLKDLKDTSIGELRSVMDLNVWANKVVIDALFGSGLRISQVVAISSGAAQNGSGGWGAYSISKSALNLLVRVYAHEHPETHFVALAPGIVQTKMIDYVVSQPEDPRHPAGSRIRQALAQGRVLSPDAAAALLAQRIPDLLRWPSGAYVDIRNM
jgi:benzil reductase ((S)-benzoin forming)